MQSQSGNGALAERLGTGLQNLLQRFDSARHLTKMPSRYLGGILHLKICPKSAPLFRHIKKAQRKIVSFINFFAPLFLLSFMKSLPAAHPSTGTENHRKFHIRLPVVLKTSHTSIDTASTTAPKSIIGVPEFLSKSCDHNANTNKLRI